MKNTTKQTVFSGLFLALALLMPFVTGQFPSLGSQLLPMHLPVLLCGFICGWRSGLLVGFVSPLLRSILFGMPPMYPVAIAMAFELASYGFLAGFLYEKFSNKAWKTIATLIIAMIGGRIVWGISMSVLLMMTSNMFTMKMFIAGAWINAIPGIILQLILIPTLLMSLKRVLIYEK